MAVLEREREGKDYFKKNTFDKNLRAFSSCHGHSARPYQLINRGELKRSDLMSVSVPDKQVNAQRDVPLSLLMV